MVNLTAYKGDQFEVVGYYAPVSDEDEDLGRVSFSLPIGSYKFRVDDGCDQAVEVWMGDESATTWAEADPIEVVQGTPTDFGTVTLDQGNRVAGTVRRSTAPFTPLANVIVVVQDGANFYQSARTDRNGRYSIIRIPDGDYTVSAFDDLDEFDLVNQVAVTLPGAPAAVDLSMVPVPRGVDTSLLRGRIVDSANRPIAGVEVCVGDPGDDSCEFYTRTRRDGTYSASVDPGRYKIAFHGPDVDEDEQRYVDEWYDDALTEDSAKWVDVGTKVVTANATLSRLGVVSGTVKLGANAPGSREVLVTLYDQDGNPITTRARSNGTYVFDELLPGPYKVRVDASGFGGPGPALAPIDMTPYLRQFWTNKFSLATANTVVVRDGLTASKVDVTLTNRLSVDTAPRIAGRAAKGKRLTATVGGWSKTVDVRFTYQWFRGSTRLPGATASTYVPVKADIGKQLRVVVTATDRTGTFLPGTAQSAFTGKVAKK